MNKFSTMLGGTFDISCRYHNATNRKNKSSYNHRQMGANFVHGI